MKVGSLFSGYSGLDLGLQKVFSEAQPTWFVEFDKSPSRILKHHYPDVPNFGDVTKVDWAEIEPVDIITAGYPCQPFSVAGKRKGTNDERHLWPYVLDAMRTIQPRFAVFENVRGHVNLGLSTVVADLASIGWNCEWTVNRASDVGAPHHRERLFIFAYPNGKRQQAQRLASGSAQEVPWDNDLHDFLAGLNRAADIERELRSRFGDYGPAILTWALATGRTPPPLIEDYVGRSVHPRFPEIRSATNVEFIEWLMDLPAGWVTGVPGLSRAQAVKALGNGVVPAQAGAAIKELIERE